MGKNFKMQVEEFGKTASKTLTKTRIRDMLMLVWI